MYKYYSFQGTFDAHYEIRSENGRVDFFKPKHPMYNTEENKNDTFRFKPYSTSQEVYLISDEEMKFLTEGKYAFYNQHILSNLVEYKHPKNYNEALLNPVEKEEELKKEKKAKNKAE